MISLEQTVFHVHIGADHGAWTWHIVATENSVVRVVVSSLAAFCSENEARCDSELALATMVL